MHNIFNLRDTEIVVIYIILFLQKRDDGHKRVWRYQGFQSGPVPWKHIYLPHAQTAIYDSKVKLFLKQGISHQLGRDAIVRFECENSAIDLIINFLWKMSSLHWFSSHSYMWTFRREHFSPDFEGPFRPSCQLSKSYAREKNQAQKNLDLHFANESLIPIFLSIYNNPSWLTVSNAFCKSTKHVNFLPSSWVYFSISVFNTKWWSLVRFPLQNPNCSGFIILILLTPLTSRANPLF
jgi:hypothetical protein